MADMLKFRKGTLAQINAADKAAGTIYIAKDEKAMYVDVDASTRIRIGDLIRVASIDKIEPPFSTTSLYYVENNNALLGYDGENWKQINGTEELVTRITAVEGSVATNASDIGTLKTDVGTLKTDVSGLKTTVGSSTSGLVKDVADLQAAIGMGEGGASGSIGGTVTQLVKDLETLEGTVSGHTSSIADHASRIKTLEDKDVALKSDVANAKTAILGQTDGVDFNGTVKGAYEASATAQTQADKGVADAATAQTKADANEAAISALNGRLTVLDQADTGKVATLESRVNTLENAGYATTSQVDEAKNAVLGTTSDAAGTATVHGALKSAAAAQSTANTNTAAISALNSKVGTAKTGTDDATGLYKVIEDSDNAIKTELKKTIREEINAANAMDYKGGVDSNTALNAITTPKVGDTYVVTAQFDGYYPGDLLIATGKEDKTTGLIPTGHTWTHVRTGYDATLEQKLKTVDGKVQLSSIANANNGQITFRSDGSAATVSVVPVSETDNNPVVTIGMVWEDFD